MPSRPVAVPAILAIAILCTALAHREARAQQPGNETSQDQTPRDQTSRDQTSRGQTPRGQAPRDIVARGKSLVDAGGCASCHTSDPGKPFAGGARIDTPFGAVYSPNLTPDRDTGLGRWSEDDFYRALHDGMSPDNQRYYPAFPYPYFTKMTRDDVMAIRAYLATLAPFHNTAPSPELRWPLNYRPLMRGWDFLFFRPGTFQADPRKSEPWNRGAYLTEAVAHCGACHTPKNVFGADKPYQTYGGGLVQGWFAPRLDEASRSGLKSWSEDDLVEYLQSGRNAHSHAGHLMADVVVNSTSKMDDADVRAIAVYLKDLPSGLPEPVAIPPSQISMTSGAENYAHACVACHEADGEGAPRIYPPLARNAGLQSADASTTLRIILEGAQTVTTPRAPNTGSMPGYGDQWSDQQIADVANYIRNSWGNAAPTVTAEQVAKARMR